MWFWRGEQRRGQESGGRRATFRRHEGCRVEPLIDGHAAMLSMCMAFLSAKRSISAHRLGYSRRSADGAWRRSAPGL